jgi:hypothetical protein
VLYCVVTRLGVGRVKTIVRAHDNAAFVVYRALADVDGGGVKRPSHHRRRPPHRFSRRYVSGLCIFTPPGPPGRLTLQVRHGWREELGPAPEAFMASVR